MDEALKQLDELTNAFRAEQAKTLDMLKKFTVLAAKMEDELEEAKKTRKEYQDRLMQSKDVPSRKWEQVKDGVYLPTDVPRYTVNVHVTGEEGTWSVEIHIVEKDLRGALLTLWVHHIPTRVRLHLGYMLRPSMEFPRYLVGEVKVNDQTTGLEVERLRKDLEKEFE